jgi:hypothetical protein
MQPLIGQTFTHCGLEKSPSHSVHSLGLILYKPFLTLIEAVGHSGSQSPHEVHKSVLIFIAMMNLLFQILERVKGEGETVKPSRLAFHPLAPKARSLPP